MSLLVTYKYSRIAQMLTIKIEIENASKGKIERFLHFWFLSRFYRKKGKKRKKGIYCWILIRLLSNYSCLFTEWHIHFLRTFINAVWFSCFFFFLGSHCFMFIKVIDSRTKTFMEHHRVEPKTAISECKKKTTEEKLPYNLDLP